MQDSRCMIECFTSKLFQIPIRTKARISLYQTFSKAHVQDVFLTLTKAVRTFFNKPAFVVANDCLFANFNQGTNFIKSTIVK